jgi:hypothetical protein
MNYVKINIEVVLSDMHTFTCDFVVCVKVNIPLMVCNDQLGLVDHELCLVLPMLSMFSLFRDT